MPLVKRAISPVNISQVPVPKEVQNDLEFIFNASLCNLMRQLASLSRQADDLFADLTIEVNAISRRSVNLQSRCEVLTINMDAAIKASLEPGVEISDLDMQEPFVSQIESSLQTVDRFTMPKCLETAYKLCEAPPPLSIMNQFRTDGKDSARLYSDPSFFFELWRLEILKEEPLKVKKVRRTKKSGTSGQAGRGGKKHRSNKKSANQNESPAPSGSVPGTLERRGVPAAAASPGSSAASAAGGVASSSSGLDELEASMRKTSLSSAAGEYIQLVGRSSAASGGASTPSSLGTGGSAAAGGGGGAIGGRDSAGFDTLSSLPPPEPVHLGVSGQPLYGQLFPTALTAPSPGLMDSYIIDEDSPYGQGLAGLPHPEPMVAGASPPPLPAPVPSPPAPPAPMQIPAPPPMPTMLSSTAAQQHGDLFRAIKEGTKLHQRNTTANAAASSSVPATSALPKTVQQIMEEVERRRRAIGIQSSGSEEDDENDYDMSD